VGNAALVAAHGRERLTEEKRLLDIITELPDLPCAWLMLYFAATPQGKPPTAFSAA